jgi:hypothetical protein
MGAGESLTPWEALMRLTIHQTTVQALPHPAALPRGEQQR